LIGVPGNAQDLVVILVVHSLELEAFLLKIKT
jgi:hypothetical protein